MKRFRFSQIQGEGVAKCDMKTDGKLVTRHFVLCNENCECSWNKSADLILFCDFFQNVLFADGWMNDCLYPCVNCTQPQTVDWKAILNLSALKKGYVLALPGQIGSMYFKTNSSQVFKICLRWLDEPNQVPKRQIFPIRYYGILRDLAESDRNLETVTGFPVFKNYHKYPFIKEEMKRQYYFVKYINTEHNYKYHFQQEKEYFTPCPNDIYNPKLFSWSQSRDLCKKINAHLPEFYSRKDQEEFIKIIKGSLDLYPIEVIFIGLSGIKPREKQVSLKSLVLIHSNMPRVMTEKTDIKISFVTFMCALCQC